MIFFGKKLFPENEMTTSMSAGTEAGTGVDTHWITLGGSKDFNIFVENTEWTDGVSGRRCVDKTESVDSEARGLVEQRGRLTD